MRRLISILALGVLLAIAFIASRAPRTIETPGRSAPVDSMQAIDSSPAKGEEDAGARIGPTGTSWQPQPVQVDRADAPVATTSPTPPAVEELKSRYPETRGALDYVESALARESRDPLWSAAMEARILDEISQKALGLEITRLDVECRTTLCRLQMVFPEELARRKFGNVPQGTVWTGEQPIMFFVEALDLEFRPGHVFGGLDGYGTPILVGYVSRPSQETP